jgi:GntR family transcriptional repressor for pyruvate dehydrogenase complex
MEAIRTPASYELVVDQIRRAIRTGRFVAGQKLPPERELARQLGVSRTTVREALRVLQGEGLVETRRGRSGGPVVLGDAVSPAAMRRMVRARLAEIDDIYDFRGVVESATARLAAQRRTDREAAHLRDTVEAMTALFEADREGDEGAQVSRFFAADHDLHLRIAQAARNPMLRKAVEDVRAAMFMPVGAIFTRLHPSANTLHFEIAQAIERQDPGAAGQAMIDHIEGTRAALRDVARGRQTSSK